MKSVLYFFIIHGFMSGVFLSVWFLIKNRQFYLSFFFFSISYLLFIHYFEIQRWFEDLPHLIWTNVPIWFLLAPFLYLHSTQTLQLKRTGSKIKSILHFVPALVAILYMATFYKLPGEEKIAIFRSFYASDTIVDYVQLFYLGQLVFYIIYSRNTISSRIKELKTKMSNASLIYLEVIPKIYFAIGIYVFISLIIAITLRWITAANLNYYTFSFLILSFIPLIVNWHLLNAGSGNTLIEVLNEEPAIFQEKPPKYEASPLSNDDIENILQKIKLVMTETELYKNADLNLPQFSRACDIPSHHISQCLNQNVGKTFFDFVNEFRINAVKKSLINKEHENITLLGIAQKAGFKSQSSFYRVFKKKTGYTPKQYLYSLK